MKHILILGGTGTMGRYLVSILCKESADKIYVTSREKHENYGNVSYIVGNAQDDDFINSILSTRHWNAIVDFMIYSTAAFRNRVHKFLAAADQYIYLSSARVYGQNDTPIDETGYRLLDSCEDKKYLVTEEYALAKARQEDILRECKMKNWTIVRPYITYSEIRLQLGVLEKENWLYRALNGRTIVVSEDFLRKKTTLTYGYDVARSIFVLMGNSKTFGEIYNVTTTENHTWGEILNIYLNILEKYLNKRPKVLYLKEYPYQHKDRPNYQLIYDRCYDRIFDNSKINKYIDTTTFISTFNGLEKCLNAFLINGHFGNINWKNQAAMDKLTGETPNIKEFPNKKRMIKYFVQRYIMPESYF